MYHKNKKNSILSKLPKLCQQIIGKLTCFLKGKHPAKKRKHKVLKRKINSKIQNKKNEEIRNKLLLKMERAEIMAAMVVMRDHKE